MGIPVENRKSGETHGVDLLRSESEILQKAKCKLFFCYGKNDNVENILSEITELGLNVEIYIYNEFQKGVFQYEDKGCFETVEQKELIEKIFQSIGYELLKSSKKINEKDEWKDGWNNKRAEEFSLGYANAQQCIVMSWNTPTYTLTPIWCKGTVKDGRDWFPLFPRQSKDN